MATPLQADDFLTWATLGVVLGGRLGYVLFYQPGVYLAHPALTFAVWEGGMSFHGGALGVAVAIVWFCRRNRIPVAGLCRSGGGLRADRAGARPDRQLHQRRAVGTAGAGLAALGDDLSQRAARCRATRASSTRHYWKAWCCSWCCSRCRGARTLRARFGWLTGAFLVGYGVARIIGEFFREPDVFLGYLIGGVTMGQLLCIPMLIGGGWLILRTR